jgi:hypothetical protein
MTTLTFMTLDDQADPTFNQLLGVNNEGVIAGYFGSGTPPTVHPNNGYTLSPPYGQATTRMKTSVAHCRRKLPVSTTTRSPMASGPTLPATNSGGLTRRVFSPMW